MARILLLLAGLLAAALLLTGLLTWILILLARVLILLARVLVWVRHRTSPLHVERSERQPTNPALVSEKNAGSAVIIAWRRFVATVAREPKPNPVSPKPLYKTLQPPVTLLPHRVPAVRK
jgi:type IV secretory pathway TrbD component